MQVTCPSCSTKYELTTQALGEVGRSVRCKRCGHKWFQTPETDDPLEAAPKALDALGDTSPSPADSRSNSWVENFEARRSSEFLEHENDDLNAHDFPESDWDAGPPVAEKRKGGWIGWVALAGCVVGLLAGTVLFRNALTAAWPPAIQIYDAVGLSVELPGTGLEIRNVKAAASMESGERVLILEGQIHNISDQERAVPEISAHALKGETKTDTWGVPPTPSRLLPGEIATFYSYRRNPGEITDIVVTFPHG